MSFDLARNLLGDVLPLDAHLNAASIRNYLQKVAQRTEEELGVECVSFVDGCPHDWAASPRPAPPLTVGIDGAMCETGHTTIRTLRSLSARASIAQDAFAGSSDKARYISSLPCVR